MVKARIFVADDDAVFLALMKAFLEDEGYSVTVLEEVNKAYRQIKNTLPDLVILDIRLDQPDTGWQVLDHLKVDPQTSHIPILVCSADVRSLRDQKERLQSLNVIAIEKPFDLEIMQAAIRRAISSEPGSFD